MADPIVHVGEVKMVDVALLKPHPKNRNKHPEAQITRLAEIIEYQGWRYPIKVSIQSGFVTTGHGRLLAAILRGWKTVPVSYQNYENEDQEYADVQADNAIGSWAELDLGGINADLADMGPDFEINMLGIKHFNLDVPILTFRPGTVGQTERFKTNPIRQMVFMMEVNEFEESMRKLQLLQEKFGIDTNVGVFKKLLDQEIP